MPQLWGISGCLYPAKLVVGCQGNTYWKDKIHGLWKCLGNVLGVGKIAEVKAYYS